MKVQPRQSGKARQLVKEIGGCAGIFSIRLLGSRTNQSMPMMPSANDQWDKGL